MGENKMSVLFTEAQDLIDKNVNSLKTEELSIEKSNGRWLAGSVDSECDNPKQTVSAMDGWAVDHQLLTDATSSEPVILDVGESTHAEDERKSLEGDVCAWVSTGAPIPRGATAIVPWEKAIKEEDGRIAFSECPKRGEFFRVRGEDVNKGDLIMGQGGRLNHWAIQALISCDVKSVQVSKKPKVALIANGNELVLPGSKKEGVSCGNLQAIGEMVTSQGADVVYSELVKDDLKSLVEAISNAKKKADLIVTLGGAADGERDYAKKAFLDNDGEVVFDRIDMKPGGPTFLMNLKGGAIGLGVSGNPLSSLIVFELLGIQIIRLMVGAKKYRPLHLNAKIDESVIWNSRKEGFIPGRTTSLNPMRVVNVQPHGSHRVKGLPDTELIIRLASGSKECLRDSEVEVLTWDS